MTATFIDNADQIKSQSIKIVWGMQIDINQISYAKKLVMGKLSGSYKHTSNKTSENNRFIWM